MRTHKNNGQEAAVRTRAKGGPPAPHPGRGKGARRAGSTVKDVTMNPNPQERFSILKARKKRIHL